MSYNKYHIEQMRTNLCLYQMGQIRKIIGQHQADFLLQSNSLTISIRRKKDDFVLTTTLSDQHLPPSFLNIFDNVNELFLFFKNEGKAEIKDEALTIVVKSLKMRQIKIELNKIALPKIDVIEEKVDKLTARTAKIEQFVNQSLPKVCEKYFEDWQKRAIKALTAEVQRLSEKVAILQQNNRKLSIKSPASQEASSPFSRLFTFPITDQKRNRINAQINSLQNNTTNAISSIFRGENFTNFQKPPKTVDFEFDVDTHSKFIGFYTIVKSTVTRIKEDQQLYMLSSSIPIPKIDRHRINMKINKIVEGLIWVGLIASQKKSEQYIGEEKEIIQLSLDGKTAIIDGVKYMTSFQQFKEGETIQMLVDIGKSRVQFYRNGRLQPFYQITIPQSMRGVEVYPYIQMINQGDSLTFF